MLSLSLEWLTSTSGSNARLALRRRVNMSATGSLILPARFGYTWDQAIQRAFPESQTGAAKLAEIAATAPAHGTTIHQTGWAGVARQLLEGRVILLLF